MLSIIFTMSVTSHGGRFSFKKMSRYDEFPLGRLVILKKCCQSHTELKFGSELVVSALRGSHSVDNSERGQDDSTLNNVNDCSHLREISFFFVPAFFHFCRMNEHQNSDCPLTHLFSKATQSAAHAYFVTFLYFSISFFWLPGRKKEVFISEIYCCIYLSLPYLDSAFVSFFT